jgi:hypothetical protein
MDQKRSSVLGISDADGSAESPGHLLPGVRGPDSRSPVGSKGIEMQPEVCIYIIIYIYIYM